jgi:hypothetical protein
MSRATDAKFSALQSFENARNGEIISNRCGSLPDAEKNVAPAGRAPDRAPGLKRPIFVAAGN